MDESLQELENELKTLQPRRAPARWLNQINRELAAELPASARPRYTTASTLGSWKWLGWRTAALAAADRVVAGELADGVGEGGVGGEQGDQPVEVPGVDPLEVALSSLSGGGGHVGTSSTVAAGAPAWSWSRAPRA